LFLILPKGQNTRGESQWIILNKRWTIFEGMRKLFGERTRTNLW